MRVLFDECLPRKLKQELRDHDTVTVPEMGWAGIKNGELLRLASEQFDAFVTMDRSLPFQQNLPVTKLAIILLVARRNRLPELRPLMPTVQLVLQTIQPGAVVRVSS